MRITATRLSWIASCLLAALPPALGADDLPPGLLACRAEQDDAKRLACYDGQVDAQARAPGAAADGAGSAPGAANAEERFGMEGELARDERERARAEGRELEELRSTVAAVASRADGSLTISLENGQVWTSRESDPGVSLKVGDPVRIRRRAMGSYVLNGRSSWSIRVKRVQ